MSLLSIEAYSDRQSRSLQRIKEKMSASAVRAEKQYQRVRQHPRKEFQGVVLVRVLGRDEFGVPTNVPETFQVWAYDISQGGIAFVSPDVILQDEVTIGLKLPDGTVRWMPGRVVRSRSIPEEDFLDYGVAFRQQRAK